MRADDDVDFSCFEGGQGFLLLCRRAESTEHLDAGGKGGEAALEGLVMLKGEDCGGSENCDLLGVGDGFDRGAHSHFGFAVADVAAQEAIHWRGAFHVALNVGDGEVLVGSFLELEGIFKFALEVAVWRKRQAWGGFSGCVEGEELLGHVFERLSDAGLARIPAGAAEFVERWMRAFDDAIALHQVHALERNVEAGVFGVAEQHEFATAAVGFDLAETLELADTVIDVDYEIAWLEFREIAEETGGADFATRAVQRWSDLEEVGIAVERELRLRERYAVGKRGADQE